MGEFNTPPVSPREEPIMDDSDEELNLPGEAGGAVEVYEVEEGSDFEDLEGDDDYEVQDDEGEGNQSNDDTSDPLGDVPDNSICIFHGHTASVFCCHIEPKEGQLAISGGEDDRAFVWDIVSGRPIFECSNHKDSVTHAIFSYDGVYVATADMAGLIQVWKTSTKAVVWSFEIGDLNWLEWHSGSHVLLAGASEGETWMWRIPSGDCKTFAGHGERNECGKLLPDGRRIAVGYADGSIKVFDLKTGNVVQHLSGGLAHSNAVSSIDCHRDNNLIITGSLDGTTKLYNAQTGKVLATLSCIGTGEDSDETDNSVEAASFCPDTTLSLAVTATLGGQVTFWDIPSQVGRATLEMGAGIVKTLWHPKESHLLVAAGLDGVVRLLDARTAKTVGQWSGHQANILDLSISSDGRRFVTSSDDQTCRVFLLEQGSSGSGQ